MYLCAHPPKFVKRQPRQRHVQGVRCGVQPAEDQPEPIRVFGLNSRLVAVCEEPFKSFVTKVLDRHVLVV